MENNRITLTLDSFVSYLKKKRFTYHNACFYRTVSEEFVRYLVKKHGTRNWVWHLPGRGEAYRFIEEKYRNLKPNRKARRREALQCFQSWLRRPTGFLELQLLRIEAIDQSSPIRLLAIAIGIIAGYITVSTVCTLFSKPLQDTRLFNNHTYTLTATAISSPTSTITPIPSTTNIPQHAPSQAATPTSNGTTVCTISNFSVVANGTALHDGDSAPAGTTLIVSGAGDCIGGVRAARFNFDSQPYGEGAEKERSVTWSLPVGKHVLCFEITVGEWLPEWRQCKTVIGQ
jgi:hypothetical protein